MFQKNCNGALPRWAVPLSGRAALKPRASLMPIVLVIVLVTGCSNIHPDERVAVGELEALGADIELTQEGRAREINLSMRPLADEDLAHMENLVALESLDLSGTDITDAGLVHLAGLTNLKKLNVGGGYMKPSRITDAGLVHLAGLHDLEQLVLSDSKITDAGLVHLKDLENLRSLYLFQTGITDEGLAHLEGLQSLEVLRVGRTGVTPEGAQEFQAKMPNLRKFVEPAPESSGDPEPGTDEDSQNGGDVGSSAAG